MTEQAEAPRWRKRMYDEHGNIRVIQKADVFIWVNGVARNIEELGPAKNLPLLEGYQAMMDLGWFGEVPEGYTIYHYIEEHGCDGLFRMVGLDSEDPPMVEVAWDRLQDAEAEVSEQVRAGNPITDEQREHLNQLYKDFEMAKKLCTP